MKTAIIKISGKQAKYAARNSSKIEGYKETQSEELKKQAQEIAKKVWG